MDGVPNASESSDSVSRGVSTKTGRSLPSAEWCLPPGWAQCVPVSLKEMVGVTVDDEREPAGLGLVEFLADLRADLQAAQEQADAQVARQEGGLRLGVNEVTVTLDVGHVATTSGEVSGKVTGKFWVFGGAEAGVKAGMQRERSGTQTLTLTLRPRVVAVSVDEHGRHVLTSSGLDVSGEIAAGEESAQMP